MSIGIGTRVSYSKTTGASTRTYRGEVLTAPDGKQRVQVATDPSPPLEIRSVIFLVAIGELVEIPEPIPAPEPPVMPATQVTR